MKKMITTLLLLTSLTSFAGEATPEYLASQDKIDNMLNKISENDENRYEIILAQRVDMSFYDYIPFVNYLTISSALENEAENDGVVELMDLYCSKNRQSEAKANAIETSFGDATGCAVSQRDDVLSACIRYDFSCD